MTNSLDKLRRDAKALKKTYEVGDKSALARVASHPPRPSGADLKHADFLHVIAQENGFASWPELKQVVAAQGLDRAGRQQRLKLALAQGQNAVVDRLLADTPNLADGLFGLQVALLNRDGVARMLADDPGRATRDSGPRRPMLHLAFSKRIHAMPARAADMIAIAEMLVENGASVNDSCAVAQGNDQRLSALYGAIGHADNMDLGQWLLDQGADPNDGESLYHATELGHLDGLAMLLKAGADPRGTNALLRAMDFQDHTAVQMLLDHGALPDDFKDAAARTLPALHQAARRMCDARMIDLLLAAGADLGRNYQGASAYGYARVFGNMDLARAIEARGDAPELTRQEHLLAMAADDAVPPRTYLDPAKLPEAYRNIVRLIQHLPGKLSHVKRLVAMGAEYDRPDDAGQTPVQLAGWEGLPENLAYFITQKPDLSHVNGYGGTLLSTIIHGSENCPERAGRDYIGCLRLALEQGVALPARSADLAGDAAVVGFLSDWARDHPGQVVQGGPF
jgi:ankyrin repeat protein